MVCVDVCDILRLLTGQFNTNVHTYRGTDPAPKIGLPSRVVSTDAAGERCGTGTKACSGAPR